MRAWLQRRWYSDAPPPAGLLPLAALYGRLAAQRRRRAQAASRPLRVPVIVVGNISIGGTGKTPFVIWLVERLREWGWRPGVISRGYGGRSSSYPLPVGPDSDAAVCGDEPVLIAWRTGAPVAVAPQRRQAAELLLSQQAVDLLVADDGLQHYALARDIEICIVDGGRGLGNGTLLPAGPLREPPSRLHEVDLVVVNGGDPTAYPRGIPMRLQPGEAWCLAQPQRRSAPAHFAGRPVHAVAGIGDPERFFKTLRALGLQVIPHAFADHHRFGPGELDFGDGLPLLMTEKDAVKCRAFAQPHWWSVPVTAQLPPEAEQRVRECSDRLMR